MRSAETVAAQERYHERLFGAFQEWESVHAAIADFTGDPTLDGLLGLDQLGHFGPHGCDRVVDEVVDWVEGGSLVICELGSGFGGALRYVANQLDRRGVRVSLGIGVEIVPEHCEVSEVITASLGLTGICPIQADVAALPIGAGSADVVFVTGSAPHFEDMGSTLAEAKRVLRPGGLLVITEEISLVDAEVAVPDTFRRTFPEDVFFVATVEERLDQLRRAGFDGARCEPVVDWACALLRDRIRAIGLFRGTAERVFGAEQTDGVIATLEVARDAYLCGAVVPAVVRATAPRAASPVVR